MAAPPAFETAARVIKGAVVAVFKCPTASSTAGTHHAKQKFRITIRVGREPSAEDLKQVEELANAKIAENAPVYQFTMPRATAEATYGRLMYDSFQPKTDDLTISYIEGWNLNLVTSPLLPATGLLGAVHIVEHAYIAKKGELELNVTVDGADVTSDAPAPTCEPPSLEAVACFNHAPAPKVKKAPVDGAAGAAGAADGAAAGEAPAAPKPKTAKAPKAKPAAAPEAPVAATAAAAPEAGAAASTDAAAAEEIVTPWDVEGEETGIDYERLIRDFGCQRITPSLVERIETLSGMKAHRFLRRDLFFSHRDLDIMLDAYEGGEPFYLYTGRGPSATALHMGHMVPFEFTCYLQQAFRVPLVVQMTDDEKYLWKDLELDEAYNLGLENIKDVIACGFDEDQTFIFSNLDYLGHMYRNIVQFEKRVTFNTCSAVFGFDGSSNIGKISFPSIQAVPSFSTSFEIPLRGAKNMRCLIPQAIDQDPYFRLTRDVAPRMGCLKPALIHCRFFPALEGPKTKMSSSAAGPAIHVTDTPQQIAQTVKRHAFSGGRETVEEHRRLGANVDIDVSYQYLTFFLEDDDYLAKIRKDYSEGVMMTSEIKQILINCLTERVSVFQARRAAVTDDVLKRFMAVRPLVLKK